MCFKNKNITSESIMFIEKHLKLNSNKSLQLLLFRRRMQLSLSPPHSRCQQGCITMPIIGVNLRGSQSALELGPSHCPNGRLGQDLGFGGFAFALKLPELLNTNLPTVRAKLGQTSSFPNGPHNWFPIG